MKGFPKKGENLVENSEGYHVFGQNIKYQYEQKVLLDEKYLHRVDPKKPILAYTSSAAEIGIISESFYRSGDNGAFQGLIPKFQEYNYKHILYFLAILSLYFKNMGYTTGMSHINDLNIKLPYKNNEIYFEFMEKYIEELEAERIEELEAYLQVTGLSDYKITKKEQESLDKYDSMIRKSKSRAEQSNNDV